MCVISAQYNTGSISQAKRLSPAALLVLPAASAWAGTVAPDLLLMPDDGLWTGRSAAGGRGHALHTLGFSMLLGKLGLAFFGAHGFELKGVANDLTADTLMNFLIHLKRLPFVLDERITLSVATKPDAFL
jgi:hypothetical protein